MPSNFEDIIEFHERFKLTTTSQPALMAEDLFKFRFKFLQEELREFEEAHYEQDLVKCADSLVDLVYVVLGTAYLMGFPWQQVWSVVHSANMQKIRADHDNPSRRDAPAFDIVKPHGWVNPELAIYQILRVHGGKPRT